MFHPSHTEDNSLDSSWNSSIQYKHHEEFCGSICTNFYILFYFVQYNFYIKILIFYLFQENKCMEQNLSLELDNVWACEGIPGSYKEELFFNHLQTANIDLHNPF
jgi:hypothetical protein